MFTGMREMIRNHFCRKSTREGVQCLLVKPSARDRAGGQQKKRTGELTDE